MSQQVIVFLSYNSSKKCILPNSENECRGDKENRNELKNRTSNSQTKKGEKNYQKLPKLEMQSKMSIFFTFFFLRLQFRTCSKLSIIFFFFFLRVCHFWEKCFAFLLILNSQNQNRNRICLKMEKSGGKPKKLFLR